MLDLLTKIFKNNSLNYAQKTKGNWGKMHEYNENINRNYKNQILEEKILKNLRR